MIYCVYRSLKMYLHAFVTAILTQLCSISNLNHRGHLSPCLFKEPSVNLAVGRNIFIMFRNCYKPECPSEVLRSDVSCVCASLQLLFSVLLISFSPDNQDLPKRFNKLLGTSIKKQLSIHPPFVWTDMVMGEGTLLTVINNNNKLVLCNL